MKPLHLNLCVVGATLGLSALAFSQLGNSPQSGSQPLAAAPDGAIVSPIAEGYFVANGASYFTRNGQAFRVEREVSIRVTPNGIIGFDGQPLVLGPGIMLTPDGRHAPIPAGINIQTLPGGTSPFPGSPTEARRTTSLEVPVLRNTPEPIADPAR